MKGDYRFLEHTADMGIEVTGPSLEILYETAAQALFDLIVPGRYKPGIYHEIETEGEDREALLVNFLNDLLFQFETEGLLFRKVKVLSLEQGRLAAEAWCEKLDPDHTVVEVVVKAVTWHDVKVEEFRDQWRGIVFLDL